MQWCVNCDAQVGYPHAQWCREVRYGGDPHPKAQEWRKEWEDAAKRQADLMRAMNISEIRIDLK